MSKRTREFPLDVMSVASARRFANDVLADLPRDLLHAVELMVSELATNSVRHAHSSFRVTISRGSESVRVEVTDSAGAVMPTMRSPGPDEPTGRGLRIVSLFSDTWGITQSADTDKSVWFTITDPQGAAEADVSGRRAATAGEADVSGHRAATTGEADVSGHRAATAAYTAGQPAADCDRHSPPWRLDVPRRPRSCRREGVRLRPRDRRPR